jgi:hypothetical protein
VFSFTEGFLRGTRQRALCRVPEIKHSAKSQIPVVQAIKWRWSVGKLLVEIRLEKKNKPKTYKGKTIMHALSSGKINGCMKQLNKNVLK